MLVILGVTCNIFDFMGGHIMKQKKHNNSPFAQLKACREKAGLSQAQLGDMIGVSRRSIVLYEAVDREPRLGSSQRLELLAFIAEWESKESHSPFAQLKVCRKKAGLTQVQLAKMVGISRYQIYQYENGDTQPRPGSPPREKLLAFIAEWESKESHSPFAQLKDCRKKAGLTQAQLAEMVGVSESRICRYENDVVQPRKGSPHRKMLLAFIEKWRDKESDSSLSGLKACREKAGLTQQELADMVGLCASQTSIYESGTVEPAELNPGPYAELKACRKKAMLTQSELGEMVGLSKQTISYLEAGKQREVNQESARKKLLAFIEKWRDKESDSSFLELKACREKAGLTQRQLGKMVGVNSGQISMYESGLAEPRIGSPHRKKLLAFIDEYRS
jgi:DNA-binding XRE family transcriptional regulator